ncbi:cytochrome P450 [Nocardia sp. NRRL S-836]|uniref:cytochrome P450 n=1 Tax=Nocardia sp. NRRL S-836 TaxID=1519492 RepID=UPI0006AE6FBD|nr:cytochrome P450 [Nocardia sp. NRRL S-836]KOV84605.1 hypothetical protein ADL03_14955 [Nocardia sp. NRRL S-836]
MDVLSELARPEALLDPYPLLTRLRTLDPVHLTANDVYLISRYADGRTVMENSALFRNPEPDEVAQLFPAAHRHRSQQLLLNSVALRNPPAHTRLRRPVARAFTASRMDALRPGVERICDQLLAPVAERYLDGEVVDLNRTLAVPLPLAVFGELLGVPAEDRAWLQKLVPSALAAMRPDSGEEELCAADEANSVIERYFLDLAERRRSDPGEDLVSLLVAVHDDEPDVLSADDLMSMLWGLWAGGLATTTTAVDYGVLAMIDHPEEVRWLRGGPAEALAFVDELLRYEAPAMSTAISRFAQQDVELSGVAVPKGADLRVLFPACNRDPDAFPSPDTFDPSRKHLHRNHLTFGHGLHYCLGAALARMELAAVLPKILSRLPDMVLHEQPALHQAVPVRVFVSLLVSRG